MTEWNIIVWGFLKEEILKLFTLHWRQYKLRGNLTVTSSLCETTKQWTDTAPSQWLKVIHPGSPFPFKVSQQCSHQSQGSAFYTHSLTLKPRPLRRHRPNHSLSSSATVWRSSHRAAYSVCSSNSNWSWVRTKTATYIPEDHFLRRSWTFHSYNPEETLGEHLDTHAS